jgi:uncharacterized protein involved in outer membrane biogenesis/outer membrane protein OmpA-like peptidoglycan-associated protein
MGNALLRTRWLRWLAYAAGALAVLLIVAWLAVPPIVRSQLESRLTEALDRRVTVESVAFDPFSLRLTLHKLAIADRVGPVPLLALDELVANLSAASIWHRAPVLDALKLVRPRVSLSRGGDGRYSIQDLLDQALAPSSGPPPRFSLNNVEIDDGSISFDDGVTARKHTLAALDVGIPFLSSLPYETTVRVTPRVAGTLNGSRFAVGGSSTPFAEPREATLDIDLDAFPLAAYVAYLPVKPRFDLAGGELTTRLKLAFVDGKPGRLELRGEARVDKLAIRRRDGSPLAAAQRVAIAIDRIDLIGGDARIASVSIDAPTVDVKRLADGTLEWAQPLVEQPQRAGAPPPSAAARSPPWQAWIGKLAVERGTIALADEASAFRSTLIDVALDGSNLSTRPGEKARVKLAFVSSDRIASFSGEADVEPAGPAATGRFALSKFSLGLLFPYYKSALAVDVQKGSLDFASGFALDASGNLRMTEGEATITDLNLAVPGSRNPLWRIPQLAAHGVDVDVPAHKVTVGEIQSQGASLRLVRERDGTLEMAKFLRPAAPGAAPTETAAWTLLAKKTAVDRVAIDFEDRVTEPPVKLAARELALTATDLTNAAGMKSNVTVRAQIGKRGRLLFAGPVANHPVSVAGQLDASGLALAPLQPYLEPRVNVIVTDGTLTAKGRISVEASEGGTVGATWKGDASVTDFAALDKPTSSDLARWKTFSLEGVDVATAPFRASVGRIALEDFYARAIVYPDGTLNLVRLVTPGASPEPAADAQTPPPATSGEREALPITIGRIDFARGNVNFSDLFIKPNYSVNLTDVTGNVSTMSEEQAGDVSVVARVDSTAPVEVQGHIHPFAKELSLDIAAKARDVDLPPLTPYSVKYAGYGIQKGKLTFDVRYQVENRKLSAENHLILDQLTFGEHVDSPTATKLPVLLAVALLKDVHGVIDIRLPIGGSLDDPKFSVGGLIIRVIVNLLTKAATAPFALLSAAFGKGEELSTLTFAEGSATIGPEAQQRIATLAKALADRPALKLNIGGRADPVTDRDALRHAAVENAMKREKMKSLVKEGAAPASIDQVAIGAEERVQWLKEAYREAPLPDRPRNVLGMLKDVPPAEMEAMLLANAKVDDEALRLLANARAQSVKNAIAATGVPAERLFVVAPRVGAGPEGASAAATLARVDLALG